MPKQVKVYVMRHGDKTKDPGGDEAVLTKLGIGQVQGAAAFHLNNLVFPLAVSSGLPRTRQTVNRAMQVIGEGKAALEKKEDFRLGFSGLDEKDYLATDQAVKAKADAEGRTPTVADWLEALPFMGEIRARLTSAILDYAQQVAEEEREKVGEGETGHVFFASHSPTGEMAVLEPETSPLLREADMICYTVEVDDDGTAKIIASELLLRPEFPPPAR